AKGLLRITLNGEVEHYQLRLSDGTDLEIRIPYMNNHKLRFDRCVGKVVTITGGYREEAGSPVLSSLASVELQQP
ncbi:MAG: hypothetical protein ACO3FE_15020, partial [Planctomycetaceae bacterium]